MVNNCVAERIALYTDGIIAERDAPLYFTITVESNK